MFGRVRFHLAAGLSLAFWCSASGVADSTLGEGCDPGFPCKAVVSICPGQAAIPDRAFFQCAELTKVTIPRSVTKIGEMAFSNCSSLAVVDIPSSVTSIGRKAFYAAGSLTEVRIPNSVTEIQTNAFQSCTQLRHIALPSSLPTIAHGAFDGCSGLLSVNLPASVRVIEEDAFKGCLSLRSVLLPRGLESIGRRAFSKCAALQKVIVPGSVLSVGDGAFEECEALARATVEMPFPEVGEAAFPDWTDISYLRPLDAAGSDRPENRSGAHHAIAAAASARGHLDERSEEVDGAIVMAAVTPDKTRRRPPRKQGNFLGIVGALMVVLFVVALLWRHRQWQRKASAEGAPSATVAEDRDILLGRAV